MYQHSLKAFLAMYTLGQKIARGFFKVILWLQHGLLLVFWGYQEAGCFLLRTGLVDDTQLNPLSIFRKVNNGFSKIGLGQAGHISHTYLLLR